MVKKGGTWKLSEDVKDEDVARVYLEWQEAPQPSAARTQSAGLGPVIPEIPALSPGYGAVGGHKKNNASTGGLY
jgi:hypothetical protein